MNSPHYQTIAALPLLVFATALAAGLVPGCVKNSATSPRISRVPELSYEPVSREEWSLDSLMMVGIIRLVRYDDHETLVLVHPRGALYGAQPFRDLSDDAKLQVAHLVSRAGARRTGAADVIVCDTKSDTIAIYRAGKFELR